MILFHRKKTISKANSLCGFTDHHSHILFGVDDGIQTLSDSLSVLERYASLGVSTVWCTPHIMEDVPNSTTELRERFEELQASWQGPVRLHLAAENMLDSLFEERLEARDLLPLGEMGNHLLVETSFYNPPMDLYHLLERIKSKGFYPVMAHPERYMYMSEHDYKRLHDMSVKFQLNLPSLAGAYGSTVRSKAQWLLRHGYYSLSGSDLHRPRMVDTILSAPSSSALTTLLSSSL